MLITKSDGTTETFKPEKLKFSLERSGATKDQVETIVREVERIVHDGMQTQDIYRHAFSLLRGASSSVTARYALRRALFGLGPTGFPFEDFLARLFQSEGYQTKTGIELKGHCATHEIDLAAYKADHSFIAEAKFHVRPGVKSDLQVALYCYARLLDLQAVKICNEDICGVKNMKIITNTKFTSAAIDYASCVGIDMLGWDFPKEKNLYNLIEKTKLYPLTVLQGITQAQKAELIVEGMVVVGDVIDRPDQVKRLGLSARKLEALLSEARQLSSLE